MDAAGDEIPLTSLVVDIITNYSHIFLHPIIIAHASGSDTVNLSHVLGSESDENQYLDIVDIDESSNLESTVTNGKEDLVGCAGNLSKTPPKRRQQGSSRRSSAGLYNTFSDIKMDWK